MEAQPTAYRKKRILVVDDDADIRDILAQFLSPQYDVLVAQDGVEGLDLAAKCPPDLIIADVTMPRLGGLAMVQHLRRGQGVKAPVFFLSGLGAPGDVIAGISAGARHYLTKPIELSDLKKRIARAFE